uniref:Premnaspirodiene oxygenase-like n=1 Tax=Nicotiana tabacum TaxID=4097 RepID=A0A1S3X954_TOBAC|nr:PREDICTED: premnaspirodiene oxygenase-like [Nicotiana tabacum]
MTKEVMKTQDLRFATRPEFMSGDIIFYNYTDIETCPYGEYWRNMRKVSAFGKVIHDQDKLIMLVKDVTLLAGGFDLANLFPSRKWLHEISGLKSRMLKLHTKIDVILENIINEHRKNRTIGKKGNDDELYGLIIEWAWWSLKGVIFNIFLAGAETSSTTIIWALAEMIRNPSVMAKTQLEVRVRVSDGWDGPGWIPSGITADSFDMTETDGVNAGRKDDLCLIAAPFGLS